MTLTKDDLRAISELLGDGLADVKSRLEQVENSQKQIDSSQKQIDSRLVQMESSQRQIDSRLVQMESSQKQIDSRMGKIENRLGELENGQTQIERGLKYVESRMIAVEDKIICLDGNVKKIRIDMEQSVVPRLQILESCYLTSYQRIQLAADKIDQMDSDIDVIKKVVTKHSEALQEIA